ncbi:MAG: energy transducer TonB [Myxococcales bacterium]|nr:energy transducer TonB [Myxococcales bacterium]
MGRQRWVSPRHEGEPCPFIEPVLPSQEPPPPVATIALRPPPVVPPRQPRRRAVIKAPPVIDEPPAPPEGASDAERLAHNKKVVAAAADETVTVQHRGELPASVIRKHIRRKRGAIRACYQRGLQSDPTLHGKVEVRFLISPSGAVNHAKLGASPLQDEDVQRCVLRTLKTWRFPRAHRGRSTHVVYPFAFRVR